MESNKTNFLGIHNTILPSKLRKCTISLKLRRKNETGFRTQGSGPLLKFFEDQGRVLGPE
jgi:hypothetical protein